MVCLVMKAVKVFNYLFEDSSVPYEFTISSGLAGLGSTDTCVFFENGEPLCGRLVSIG